jgi:hypothetical protein
MSDKVIVPKRWQGEYKRWQESFYLYDSSMICKIIEQLGRAEAKITTLRAENKRLRDSLELVYDKWDNGVSCHESDEDGNCEEGEYIGKAFDLSMNEEKEILSLIPTSRTGEKEAKG